eukprot:gnl/MRDRNA2_/MRDRNA2_21563_c0_seq1.p1 gnl/MRDRNA2_/MRDRNA2_21563_c0~~gnl/MRDRNA2_/MRDRNA2_21563_c0_seq1.p1  ORF type:complete len:437 (-),score=100.98 gnl/MRDRNA2_/MRDRNA2_21563_c0_seq1:115-1386(-)
MAELRDLACNFVKAQCTKDNMHCVYAATQDRDQVLQKLEAAGILDQVTVVAARDSIVSMDEVARSAEATAVAGTACAVAESFAKDKGQDTLVIVDTIDQLNVFWDATTSVLMDVYGEDGVHKAYDVDKVTQSYGVEASAEGGAASELRAFYSSLIQRAANYNMNKGGGSLTLAVMTVIPRAQEDGPGIFTAADFEQSSNKIKARIDILVKKNIPLTASTLKKIDIPIPSKSQDDQKIALDRVESLISMTDGQIWLDEEFARAGQCPSMDYQKSLPRVGIGAGTKSRVDAPAIRRVVEGLRLDFSQAADMEMGAERTYESAQQIRKKKAWLLAMQQDIREGDRTLSESCVALLAASIGALDDILDAGGLANTEKGQQAVKKMLKYVCNEAPSAMKEIDESLDVTDATRKELEEAIRSFFIQAKL